jgi:hypothetical protein
MRPNFAPAPVVRNAGDAEEMVLMRWACRRPERAGRRSPISATVVAAPASAGAA